MAKIKIDRDFTKNRSDKYQHLLVETPSSPDMLTEFADFRGLTGQLNAAAYNEEMYELKTLLKAERWKLIEEKLTPRQREVIEYLASGMTQIEVAKKLGVNQSSITKSVNGNCDYGNKKRGKKVYGGAKKKLRRHQAQSDEIQAILDRMAEIQSEMY